ncbi:hypothetical protein P692DRAFT_20873321 [Suillus brevipes Sb2]|nr:hypothetical protein P692DRAFT_20873321 [Suillus brevipes Sb2]
MATGVNIFINKILDDLFPPLSTPNHISSPIVHHSVDATVLNPDALNLNYDSDDSMQVDSENEQVNNHHTLVDNFQDLDAEDASLLEKEREKEELETYKVVERIVSQRDGAEAYNFPTASDSPKHELSGLNRLSEQPRYSLPEVEQGSTDNDECQLNSHGNSSTSQRRSERRGCIQPSSSRRILYTLPPLSRERTYDRDVRLLPSRFTKFMDHSPAQDEQPRRICTPSESYHDSRKQRPVSLSVFNAPTATYAWERYEPESQIPYPRPLYVDHTGRSSTQSASSSSISSLLDSPCMPSPALSDRSISTPTLLPPKRRSSSPAGP